MCVTESRKENHTSIYNFVFLMVIYSRTGKVCKTNVNKLELHPCQDTGEQTCRSHCKIKKSIQQII